MVMALGMNLSSEGGSGGSKFLQAVKFDAKSGDLVAVNRIPMPDMTWEKEDVEISYPVKVVMDLANIKIGWITFAPKYNAEWANAGERVPAKPSDDHKQAVYLKVFFKEHGLREFTPTSKTVLRAIDQLHDAYLSAADAHPGKFPVVTIEGTETVKVQTPQGELRFKAPKWSITGWTDWPAETAAPPAEAPAKPAPSAKKILASAPVDVDEF